jgi:small basic protein (TIGR04137 family)
MGLHPSLKRGENLGASRSVMKRTERIKWLKEKGKWSEGDDVLGLPKIKIVKLKALKKEKQKEEGAEGTEAEKPAEGAAKATETTKAKESGKKKAE